MSLENQNNDIHPLAAQGPLPDHMKAAAKKTMAGLLNMDVLPEQTPTDVQKMVQSMSPDEQKIVAENKDRTNELLRKRLNPNAVETPPQTVAAPAPPTEPKVDAAPASTEPKVESTLTNGEAPKEEAPTDPELEEGNDKDVNFKKLRTKYSETKRTAKELLEKATELETTVKRYEAGEIKPPKQVELEKRVQELEPLEHVFNLKKSPQYKEKYLDPLNRVSSQLDQIAKDYNLPSELLDQASRITNQKELNAFLVEHFDDVGALEAKGLIREAQKIRGELAQAEAEPKKALDNLLKEHEALQTQKELERRNKLSDTAKNSWMRAILKIREEGKVKELVPRDGDDSFNQTWVEPIQNKAAEQYGSLMATLVEYGIQKAEPELVQSIAELCLLATAGTTAIERANAAENELQEIKQNTQRRTPFLRPSAQGVPKGSVGSNGASPQQVDKSPQATARNLLNQVGVR